MEIRIGSELIKVTKNTNNRFWNPIGLFDNISEIKIEDEWYKCGINYVEIDGKLFVQISHPMKVDEITSRIIKVHTDGTYKEIETTSFKSNLLKLFLNQHKLNFFSFKVRCIIAERRNIIYISLLAITLSIIYYLINELNNNSLMKYISESNWLQTIIIFLTISSFINIFYPFTINKQIDKKDIENIFDDKTEREKVLKEIKKRANI